MDGRSDVLSSSSRLSKGVFSFSVWEPNYESKLFIVAERCKRHLVDDHELVLGDESTVDTYRRPHAGMATSMRYSPKVLVRGIHHPNF